MVLTDEDREALIAGDEDAEIKLIKSAMGSRCCCVFFLASIYIIVQGAISDVDDVVVM